MHELSPDGEQDPATFQDFFGKLVIDAELPLSSLPNFLLVVFKLGHNRSWSAGIRSLPSQAVDSMKGDVLHCISRQFQMCLDRFLLLVQDPRLPAPGFQKTPGCPSYRSNRLVTVYINSGAPVWYPPLFKRTQAPTILRQILHRVVVRVLHM